MFKDAPLWVRLGYLILKYFAIALAGYNFGRYETRLDVLREQQECAERLTRIRSYLPEIQ